MIYDMIAQASVSNKREVTAANGQGGLSTSHYVEATGCRYYHYYTTSIPIVIIIIIIMININCMCIIIRQGPRG